MWLWTKESAIAEIEALIQQIAHLRSERRFSTEHTRWLIKSRTVLQEVFGADSLYFRTFAGLSWGKVGEFMVEGYGDTNAAIERVHQTAYIQQLESAKGLLEAAIDHIKRVDQISSVYQGKNTAPESSALLKIINLAEHKLRKVIRDIPPNERIVQDAFENLLIGSDIVYSREKVSIEYSSKTYEPDFTIEKIDLAIEIKLCPNKSREKEMVAEINDDILAYGTMFGNLLFVVYDVGYIRDVDRFSEAFEQHQNVIVRVVKH